MAQWHYPYGTAKHENWDVVIDTHAQGWEHTGLRVVTLDDTTVALPGEDQERIILPMSGAFHVEAGTWSVDLHGRDNPFTEMTDLAYIGPRTDIAVSGRGRVAIASAHATSLRSPVYLAASQVPVELRGTGNMSREVRNFGTPQVLEAESIIACEVLTPGGNWSSYPPHKHDHELEGIETELEEIYYFELRQSHDLPSPRQCTPMGYQRVSASDDRAIDVLAEVHNQDVVLVPFGWHGPSMAAPGYDMYYLNVMAGPGRERAWRITDHPDHTWVRDLWPHHQIDPRLPFTQNTR